MATLDDVLDGLVILTQQALSAASITTGFVGPYKGWPIPDQLDYDVRAGNTHISIFPMEWERLHTRRPPTPFLSVAAQSDLTATLSGPQLTGGSVSTYASGSITLTGDLTFPVTTIFLLGTIAVPFTPTTNATLDATAAGLVTAINASAAATTITASASGAVVTLTANALGVSGNAIAFNFVIGGEGSFKAEYRRQTRQFAIHVWAPNDAQRGLFANTIDEYISQNFFMVVTAQQDESARIKYVKTVQTDQETKQSIYRRILIFEIEYPTTIIFAGTQVLDTAINWTYTNSIQT